ncbi:ribonuclease III [Clostridium argentinense CDC 2741]|uniref:Ribonuclease 3 n=1 Tax=Clostridium argentinense CDC 2741 TaxID=1418104 RepID=A0A0C1R197_9CLOT|nr:ribonuclease III [Clostridium argentinense]ARC85686.1 ribonuclease III [Clostridium argentinense]KIE47167.1 ribonuclease III [Clostridium argentinense CDC 2741]NFF40790.1 ribonuclease III [Clostridium argentinense]NFP50722.1 ribonuclease III [Clostridium argentinense]NFP73121.1 ribonuclease III [Clostridium argentinense]
MKIRPSTLELQNKLRLNFDNLELLQTAITHSSYANQKKDVDYNERLEFLGDSVLQLVISQHLFSNNINESEGYLTRVRSLIVCENSLYEIAKGWNLGSYITMSKGEEMTGGRTRVSILADAVEAIIAAIYLDKGLEYVREFILTNFKNIIHKALKNQIIIDYKTKLQEILQKNGEVSIIYNLIKYEGPPHRRLFYVEVLINGISKGSGVGYSKKEAEQNAAREVLLTKEEIYE